MKRKLWLTGICLGCAVGIYVGSFFLILLGQRMEKWDWVDDLGLGYKLDSETGPHGLVFTDDPWMAVFKPLSTPIYKIPDDPHAPVALSGYGKVVIACYEWGNFNRMEWKAARDDVEKWRGFTGSEWFPEHYRWQDTGQNRYPLPND